MRPAERRTDSDLHSTTIIANLREIARALSAAWDVSTTLDLIARKTAQVMQVDSCSIYLLEPGTRRRPRGAGRPAL